VLRTSTRMLAHLGLQEHAASIAEPLGRASRTSLWDVPAERHLSPARGTFFVLQLVCPSSFSTFASNFQDA
jgi:hypothetical protein